MQVLMIVLVSTIAFSGVAWFFAYWVRNLEVVDRKRQDGTLPKSDHYGYVPIPFGSGYAGDSSGGASCGDGGGGCS
jgi:hypothetical protein